MWKIGDLFSIILLPSNALHGVFIYFYTITLTGQKHNSLGSRMLHLSVYAVLLVFHITSFIIDDSPRIYGQLLTKNTLYIVGIGMINSLIYVCLAFIKMKKYSVDIRDYFSEIEKRDINWFLRILITPLIFFTISNAGFWYAFFKGPTPLVAIIILTTLCVSMFIILSLLINQPLIVNQNRDMYSLMNSRLSNRTDESPKYSRLNIDLPLQKLYAGRLEEYMEKEKPYLDEKLNIKDLSEQMKILYYHLSVVINNIYGKNFYNYINYYRVSEVIKAL